MTTHNGFVLEAPASAAGYVMLRDRIESLASLARAAQRSAEELDGEWADVLTFPEKTSMVTRIWNALMREIELLDV